MSASLLHRRRREPAAPPAPILCTACHRHAQRVVLERDAERLPFCSVACLIRWLAPPPEPASPIEGLA
jgi:hypothetical protein